jgi:hypothetical protein
MVTLQRIAAFAVEECLDISSERAAVQSHKLVIQAKLQATAASVVSL